MVGSISAGWQSSDSTSATMRWQQQLTQARGRADAADSRRDTAAEQATVRPDWQPPRIPQVTQSGSVDMYM